MRFILYNGIYVKTEIDKGEAAPNVVNFKYFSTILVDFFKNIPQNNTTNALYNSKTDPRNAFPSSKNQNIKSAILTVCNQLMDFELTAAINRHHQN